jgi:signal transduction histidine kinase
MIRLKELWRAQTFRLACLSSALFALLLVLLCGVLYSQAALWETAEIDGTIANESSRIARGNAGRTVEVLVRQVNYAPGRGVYSGLFDANHDVIAGNIQHIPDGLPIDGKAHSVVVRSNGVTPHASFRVRAMAITLSDHTILVNGRSSWQLEELKSSVIRTIAIGAIPILLISLAAGAFLSRRAVERVRQIRLQLDQIMAGELRERLPVLGTADNFDRLAVSVNRMLDEIGVLLDQIRGIGGDIAHDLRTPLTWVRTHLERGRESAGSHEELIKVANRATGGLGQALSIVTALLRITEIERGQRRAGFGHIDLVDVVRDVFQLYDPIARAADVTLSTPVLVKAIVIGDRALLVEALANIVDNAIKFTPIGGRVEISLSSRDGQPKIQVSDTGPGIPVAERAMVMRRFYRADKSRHLPGSGLGLGLVGAITKLHGFSVVIGESEIGCLFEIECWVRLDRPGQSAMPSKEDAPMNS